MLNEAKLAKTTEVVIAPASVHLHKALTKIRPDVAVSAQDVWTQGGGAFTGETSAEMLKDLGAKWTVSLRQPWLNHTTPHAARLDSI